jgi:ribonuclease P protein component
VIQACRRKEPAGAWIGEGFTATKRIGGAVQRNRAKRRLRAAAQLVLPDLGVVGADYVFIARSATLDATWPALLDDMKTALISLAPRLAETSGCNSA